MRKYKGVEYKVLIGPMSNLCAYVKLPDDFPAFDDYQELEIECHWGLTFACDVENKEQSGWQNFNMGRWIGWDYGHANDIIPKFDTFGVKKLGGKLWQPEDVEDEIFGVIEQIKAQNK